MGRAAVRPCRRPAGRRHGDPLDARRVVGHGSARPRRVPRARTEGVRPAFVSNQTYANGLFTTSARCRTILPDMAFATAEPLRAPRAGRARRRGSSCRRRAHHDPRRRLRHGDAPSCASPCCAAGAAGAVVRRARLRRGARRRLLRAAGRHARSARSAPAASPAATSRSPRRGLPCARACTSQRRRRGRIARRDELPAAPRGDLLQAGPLLVRDGAPVFRREEDREGFSAGEAQFDSDITDGRYPRAALGLAPGPDVRGRVRRALAP